MTVTHFRQAILGLFPKKSCIFSNAHTSHPISILLTHFLLFLNDKIAVHKNIFYDVLRFWANMSLIVK